MQPARLFAAWLTIGAVPFLLLLGLMLHGDLAPMPGLLGIAVNAAGAFMVAAIWTHDIELLVETLRHAMAGGSALARVAAAPRIPAVARITRGIERLSRSLDSRASEIGALLRANDAIIERLPDPLLVLDLVCQDRPGLVPPCARRSATKSPPCCATRCCGRPSPKPGASRPPKPWR